MLPRHASRLASAVLTGALALTSVACGGGGEAAASSITIDTLPGGIVRTMSASPIEKGRWSLVQARELQPAENDPAELMNPEDVALADDGSIILVDSRPTRIKVYDRDGRLQRTIGRDGSGPGEYRSAFIALRGDTLAVQDPSNSRGTAFDWRTGAMIAQRRTACCYWHPIGIDGDGRVLLRSIESPKDTTLRNYQGFMRFHLGSSTVDSLFVLERQGTAVPTPWTIRQGTQVRMTTPVPLQPRAFFAVDPAGTVVSGWSGEYLLRTTRDGRDTLTLFGRTKTPSPVTADEKQRIVEERIADMRKNDPNTSEQVLRLSFLADMIPDTRPAYENFTIDRAGRRWVRLTQPDTSVVAFDLFDVAGRWLDEVRVPAAGWPKSVYAPIGWSKDEAAVVLEGEDGRPLVRVYSIVRKP